MSSAEIIIVGDEILHGEIQDKNGPWLINQLTDRGITVDRLKIIPDESSSIGKAINRARAREVTYILITGGIGPTHDDCTRDGVADGLDRPMETNQQVIKWLETYYDDDLNESRKAMANLPKNSHPVLLEDTPAIAFQVDNVFVFPGIPELMKPLFHQFDAKFSPESLESRTISIRAREGDIARQLKSIQESMDQVSLGCYPHPDGTLTLKIRGANKPDVQQGHQRLLTIFEDNLLDDSNK